MENDANYLHRSPSCGLSRKLAHHAHTIWKSPIRLEEVGQIVTKARYRSAFPGAEPRRV
jgi:hypothetical protein